MTFVCVHIARKGGGVGFELAAGEEAEPWPTACCDACLDETATCEVSPLCKHCWEEAFARNTHVGPHPAPEDVIAAAQARAGDRQERWIERHSIGTHRHWEMQLEGDAPWLGFGESKERIYVRADALVIGSWSKRGTSWLWGWGNAHWEPRLTAPFVAVKRYGESHGIERLWRMGGQATEDEAFALAAAALDLVPGLEGLYRVPGDTSLFLAVKNTQLVS